MKVRVAGVQPRSFSGRDEHRNAEQALDWLDRASAAGADLVVFPEGYPGPISPVNEYDAFGPLAERAARHRLHVVASRLEPTGDGRHHVVLHLIGDRGETLAVYRRTTPTGPYIYHDIPMWEFDYAEADDASGLVVHDTSIGRIGLQVCSEVFSSEQSRLLALRGADIVLYPAGGKLGELIPPWSTMVWARAIENLVYTVAVQNIYDDDDPGIGIVGAPEEILAREHGVGMMVTDLDLDRLRFLRDEDEKIEVPRRCRTVPGLMRWRRPDVLADLQQLDSDAPVRE